VPGQLADLAVLSGDYGSIPAEEIKHLKAVLTMVGGRIVYALGEFGPLGPPPLPVSPDWAPVKTFGGYASQGVRQAQMQPHRCNHAHLPGTKAHRWILGESGLWSLGCDCFAFLGLNRPPRT
jgi:hypothetical protein